MKTFLALLVVCTFWASAAHAQATGRHDVFGHYQKLNWDQRDGLPQNSVLAITATSDGYVWLGTYEGAARFDGVRFTVFSPSTTTGIGNSFVPALLEQRDGTLWLATYGGGLSRFSGGKFTQFTVRDGLSSDFVLCLFEDRAGRLWLGTEGGGVNVFSQGRFTAYTVDQGLPSNQVRDLVDDGRGGVLAGTNRGIARITDGRVQAFGESADLERADISKLLRAPDGSLWAGTIQGRLFRVDAAGTREFGVDQGWTPVPVESLFADEEGRMWVGTNSRGVFRYSAGRFENYALADGLPGARVGAIARGDDRSVWIGTDGGLVRLKRPRVTVYTTRDGLGDDYAGSIFQDDDGNVWVETGDLLTRYANGTFTLMTAADGLPEGRLRLARSTDGRLLLRSRAGLLRWKNGRFVMEPQIPGVSWDRVNIALYDRAGTLWLGIRDGGMMRVRDGHATPIGVKDGLADESVHSFYEDRHGDIWVATVRNGMTRISNGTLTSWSTKDGLAANHVKAFYEAPDGTLWIGTHGGGLSRFKDGRFANISARQGLYNDNVFQILEADGNLWMNCNTGIWRTSLSQLNDVADGKRASVESFAYDTADGMVSSEGVGANEAGWKLRDGSLWFPTIRGIVAIDPRGRPGTPPRIAIEGISIDGTPAAIEEPVRITPDQEQFDIRYTALSWSRPQAIKFRFRLMGLDRNWVDAGSRRTAFYSHLPPGSYHFAVTADDGDGVWNGTGRTLAIVVLPRIYQTWWFQAAVVSALAALTWLSWRYRIGQIRREQAVQLAFSRQLIASQEHERQRIAGELHDSLGQNLLVVKNRAALGALALPDGDGEARKQFDEIASTVAHTLQEVRAISHNLRPPHLDQLGLTMTIRAMIEQTAESSGIAMVADLDDVDGAFPPDEEITIYRIVQESVNNVVKHARAREVQVALRSYEEHVEITIRDDGRGFTPAATGAGAANGGGFGLKGLAERVQMLGGTHTIDSAPGRGTTVSVRIGTR